jgi:hypothetical protein
MFCNHFFLFKFVRILPNNRALPLPRAYGTLFISTMYERYDSAVGIVTGYGLDDRGVEIRFPVGARIFCSPCRLDRFWPPASYPVGTLGLFPRG